MDQGPQTPSDDSPEPDWGQRRRGTAPPPRASWEQAREEFERASRAWEQHKSEANGHAEGQWDPPGAGPRATPGAGPDLSGLLVLLDTLRQAAPAELQERTSALIREVLLTLRALIDWYLEHLDQPAQKPTVEDIPID
jgi:hypothetical protein